MKNAFQLIVNFSVHGIPQVGLFCLKVCTFRKWYFGKCHMNKRIPLKFYAIFDEVHCLNEPA